MSVDEQATLTFTASATDQDIPKQALTYTLDAASIALGMSIDSASGRFVWTPSLGQMGMYPVTITATDNGANPANRSDSKTFGLTVGGVVNLPARKTGYSLLLRLSAKDLTRLELVDAKNVKQQYWSAAAEKVFKLTIRGLEGKADTLTVDYANGPFVVAGGVVFDAKGGKLSDTLAIKNSAKGASTDDTVTIAEDLVIFNDTPYILQGVESVSVDTGKGYETIAVSSLGANVTLIDSSGTELLNFSQAANALSLNLAATSAQKILAGNLRTLTLKGTFENATGTPQADLIRGNTAANTIRGGVGDDTLYGGGGNDTLYGEAGNDRLYGEAGTDWLYGGPGNNVLLGGDGNDTLDAAAGVLAGSPGRNLLIGGKGADTLQGGKGDDILLGGTTSYDSNTAALTLIMQEWTSDHGFDARCGNLTTGFPLGKSLVQLTTTKTKKNPKGTVFDDKARDTLFGDSGRDWFFGSSTDDVRDRTIPEDR
jgi:Ca2+-binding RTX toxin-like protein